MKINAAFTPFAAIVGMLLAPSADALDSPVLDDGLTVEATWAGAEAAVIRNDDALIYLLGARLEGRSLDARIYVGVNHRPVIGELYEFHLQAEAGPRMAFRGAVGVGAWGSVRARGVWRWSRLRLHAGLFTDSAVEFSGIGGWRVRPGGDIGVGYAFDAFEIWLNANAGYSLGGAGAGGVHADGSLGVGW